MYGTKILPITSLVQYAIEVIQCTYVSDNADLVNDHFHEGV